MRKCLHIFVSFYICWLWIYFGYLIHSNEIYISKKACWGCCCSSSVMDDLMEPMIPPQHLLEFTTSVHPHDTKQTTKLEDAAIWTARSLSLVMLSPHLSYIWQFKASSESFETKCCTSSYPRFWVFSPQQKQVRQFLNQPGLELKTCWSVELSYM